MKKVILNALWAKIKNTFVATNSDATLKTLTITGTGTGISISATSGEDFRIIASGKNLNSISGVYKILFTNSSPNYATISNINQIEFTGSGYISNLTTLSGVLTLKLTGSGSISGAERINFASGGNSDLDINNTGSGSARGMIHHLHEISFGTGSSSYILENSIGAILASGLWSAYFYSGGDITMGYINNLSTGQKGISISNNNITFKDKPGSSLYSATYDTHGITYSGGGSTINLNGGIITGVNSIQGATNGFLSGFNNVYLNSSGNINFNWGAGPGTINGVSTITMASGSSNTINMASGEITIGNVDNPTTGQNGISISDNNITFKGNGHSARYNDYGISYSGTAATIDLNGGYINGVGGIYGNNWSVSGVSLFNLNSSGGLYFNWGVGPGTISGVTTIGMASGSSSNVNLNGGYITGGTGITLNSSGTLKFGSSSGLGSITGVNSLNLSSGGQIIIGSTNDVVLQNNYLSFKSGVGSATIDGVQNLNLVGTGQLSFSGGASGNGSISGVKTINMASGGGVSISFGPTISGQGLNMNYKDISNLYHMDLIGDIKINGSQLKIDGTNISFYSGTGNGVISGVRDIYFSSQATLTGYISGSTGSKKTIMSNIVIDSSNTLEAPMIMSLPYSQLVTLRDNNNLVKGRQYRITDYVTTTTQANTQSAGHAFDIIVIADDVNKLNENARAIQRYGDTYFANSNLAAWEIKYCLDNDTDRFAWADSTNGKGVIYYMKDEFGNECPYDFKNILYVKKISFTAYGKYGSSFTTTYSRYETNDTTVSGTAYYGFIRISYIPGPGPMAEYVWTTTTSLTTSIPLYSVSSGSVTSVTGTVIGVDTEEFATYTFDKNGSDASISGDSQNVRENKIASYVNNNKQTLNSIYFRGTVDLSVYGNSFNVNCHDMTFRYSCHSNTFGINNYGNSFGNTCFGNSFGNGCYNNSFGNFCRNNLFNEGCDSNSFGNECSTNSFGTSCSNNSFGNYCNINSFGTGCSHITFGKDNTICVIVENGNSYITLTSTQTTSNTNRLRNITIAQGVNNTSGRKTISHNTLNDTFKTTYQPINSQTISV